MKDEDQKNRRKNSVEMKIKENARNGYREFSGVQHRFGENPNNETECENRIPRAERGSETEVKDSEQVKNIYELHFSSGGFQGWPVNW